MSWNASGLIKRDDVSIFVNNADTAVYRGEWEIKKPMPRPLEDHPIPLL